MRKVLFILGQLSDQDVEWLGKAGQKRELKTGDVLIREGEPVAALFILLDGELDVDVAGVGRVAHLLPGEVVGEMSFVDKAPPSASVIVREPAQVLVVDKGAIEMKINEDPAFGMRFYRALATFLSDRLRSAQSRRGTEGQSGKLAENHEDELDDAVLESISLAGDRFGRLMNMLKVAST